MTSREELKAHEFYENFALLPRKDGNIKKARNVSEPVARLVASMDARRIRNQQRDEETEAAEARSALLQPELILERTIAAGEAKINAAYEEQLVRTTLAGDHIFKDVRKEALDTTLKESQLYDEAAQQIKDSQEMRAFGPEHARDVVIPRDSQAHIDEQQFRREYVDFMGDRLDAAGNARRLHQAIRNLVHQLNDAEDEVEQILFEVDEFKLQHDFDWQLSKQNRVRELRHKIGGWKAELFSADKQISEIVAEVHTRFPDLKDTVKASDSGASSKLISVDEEETGANDISVAYGWVMGRLTVDGKVNTIFYGQFTEATEPPLTGWMFLGRNIQQSLRNTASNGAPPPPGSLDAGSSAMSVPPTPSFKSPPASPATTRPETGSPGSPGTVGTAVDQRPGTATGAKKQNGERVRLYEEEMETCREDEILCSPAKVAVNKSFSAHAKSDDFFRISGCTIGELNGRYLEWGVSCGARRYRNVKGWVLFRTRLHEIPELGIYVDGCYNAFRGPSVTELLNRRAAVAYKELLLFGGESDGAVEEGSAPFKRRFAEISRSGTKMITADQTEVTARVNEVRSKVRSKANSDMLEMIAATGSGHAPGNGDDEDAEERDARIRDDPRKAAQELIKKRAFDNLDTASLASSSQATLDTIDDALVEVKVTMGRNTNYQRGSQSYQVSRDKRFLAEEAELAREAVARIEARESCLRRVRLDSGWLQKQYIESENWDGSMEKGSAEQNQAVHDLLHSIKSLRDATIDALEAIGAWTRVAKVKQDALKQEKTAGAKYSLNTHGTREYCVVIAAKGPQLYPESKAVTTGPTPFRRGQQEAKVATITKYIGKFADKEEAFDAFGRAAAAVPLEQRPFAYSDKPPMYCGLRSCRKHYLVRSDGVPSDLPCEVCASGDFGRAHSVVRGAKMDSRPQFIWHGVDYMENMLSDCVFLKDNIPLQRRLPDLRVDGNPLLLISERLGETLHGIDDRPRDAFNTLRGRGEQVKDALTAGTKLHNVPVVKPPTRTDKALTGKSLYERQIMERTNDEILADVPLDETILAQQRHKTDTLGIKKMSNDYTVLSTLRPSTLLPSDTDSREPQHQPDVESEGFMEPASPSATPRVRLPPGSPDVTATAENSTGMLPTPRVAFVDTMRAENEDQSILAHAKDKVSVERLQRAMAIIYQSAKFSKDTLDESVLPDSVRASALTRRPLERPDLRRDMTPLEKFMEKQEKLEELPDTDEFIPTETKYVYRGAVLATTQMRPPLAARDPAQWCRGDEGEWASLSKGRNVRSWEFHDKMLYDGRRRAAERKALQDEIRRLIGAHVVNADVPRIKKLIFEAGNVRGGVLNLDVLQAQSYLAHRKKVIHASTKVSSIYRAVIVRRYAKEMAAKLRRAKERAQCVKVEAVALTPSIVTNVIAAGLENVKHSLAQWDFVGVVSANGVTGVASLHQMPRGYHHSQELCPSCSGQSTTMRYNHITKESHKIRGACTCKYVTGMERWLVRLYDPLSRSSIHTVIPENKVRHFIRRINRLSKQTVASRAKKLVGRDFGDLRLLFESMDGASATQQNAYAVAKLAAAKEGSLLPLLPKFVDDTLMASLEHPHETPANALWKLTQTNYYTGGRTKVVFDKEAHYDDTIESTNNWQPFADYRRARIQYERAEHHCTQLGHRIAHSEHEHETGTVNLANLSLHLDREQSEYEDARMQYLLACENLENHRKRFRDTMDFEKRNREHWDAMLTGDEVEMDGIREPLLDGNAYWGLNKEKPLNKAILDWRARMNELYIKQAATVVVRGAQQNRLKELHEFVVEHKAELVVYRPVLPYLRGILKHCAHIIKHAGNTLLRNFVLPRQPGREGRRQMRTRKEDLVFIRDPIIRAKVEYRANWVFMSSRVMNISPWKGPCNTGTMLATSVSYYIDPVTDYHLLVLGSQDISGFEEALMHEELYFSHTTFTALNGVTPHNETLLRPSDVRELMRMSKESKERDGNGLRRRTSSQHETSSVHVIESRRDHLQRMEKGFNRRRRRQTELDFEMAEAVLDQLHLQWYTGRPCLGMLHFERRKAFCHVQIQSCLWWRDIAKGSSSTPPPRIYHEQCMVAGKLAEVAIRTSWGDVDVSIFLNGILTVSLVVAAKEIITSLADSPQRLASFVYELMLNKLSVDTIEHIISRIDFRLPGEEGRLWRPLMLGNIPSAVFVAKRKGLFRGPQLITHRFLWGRYVSARFTQSAAGDIRIEINPPTNGQFWIHGYKGDTITVDLTLAEIRTFVLLVCRDHAEIVSPRFSGNLDVLHPFFRGQLFSLLLDSLTLDYEYRARRQEKQQQMKEPKREDAVVSTSTTELASSDPTHLWLDELKHRTSLALRRFGHWASKTVGKIPPVDDASMREVSVTMEHLVQKPQWWLEVHKHNKSKDFVDIFQGLWIERHAEGFYKPDVSTAFRTLSHHVYEGRPLLTRDHLSFWRVRILTDNGKRRLYIKMRPSDLEDTDVQLALQEKEREDMATADVEARRINVDEQVMAHHGRLAAQVKQRERKVQAMVELLRVERRKAERFADMLSAARHQLEEQVDTIFSQVGAAAFAAACENVPLGADPAHPLRDVDVRERVASLYPVQGQIDPEVAALELHPAASLDKDKELSFIRPPAGIAGLLRTVQDIQRRLVSSSALAFQVFCLKIEKTRTSSALPPASHRPRRPELVNTSTAYDLHKYQPTIIEHNRLTFRRPGSWKRYKPHKPEFHHATPNTMLPRVSERAIRNHHTAPLQHSKALQLFSRYCVVGQPVKGPFDLITFQVYEPLTRKTWTQTVAARPSLPYLKAPKALPLSGDTSLEAEALDVSVAERGTTAALARLCAERVSSVALMVGTARAAEHIATEKLGRRVAAINDKLREETQALVKARIDMRMSLDTNTFPSQFGVTKIGAADVRPIDIPLYAVFMPAHEETPPVPLQISAYEWEESCMKFMRSDDVIRTQTVPAVVTTYRTIPEGGDMAVNERVMDWMSEFVEHMGWREGDSRDALSQKFRREIKHKISTPVVNVRGDCILFMREGEGDLMQLLQWCDARIAYLGPIFEAERERIRTQKARRAANHALFRSHVFRLAKKYRPVLEQLFHFRHNLPFEHKFAQDGTRVLHARALLLDFAVHARRDPEINQAFLVDDAELQIEEKSRRFDGDEFEHYRALWADVDKDSWSGEKKPIDRDPLFPRSIADKYEATAVKYDAHSLDPNRQQVVYAVYLLHCRECKCRRLMCRIPGCEVIRQNAADICERGEASEGDQLWGTGKHPVERAVRTYLSTDSDFPERIQAMPHGDTELAVSLGPDPYSWDMEQKEQARKKRELEALLRYMTIDYRTADKHALQFRYASRRLLRPEMAKVMHVQDYKMVVGGKGYLDESRMDTLIPADSNDVCEMIPPDANDKDAQVMTVTHDEAEAVDKREVLIELKMKLVQSIVGSGTRVDGSVVIPSWSIDPYPMEKDMSTDSKRDPATGILFPMSHHLFNWLSSHLHIAPICKSQPAKRGQEHYELQFNRKYNEEVIYLDDGSLVVIMVLFGVVPEGRLRSDLEHGCPSAANQYCAINKVNDLIPGLTISIYDIRSDINKAIKLYDKGLARFADVIEVAANDLPKISERFIQLAHILVRLDRVGKLCTAVSLDPSGLNKKEDKFPIINENMYDKDTRTAAGSRQVTTTRASSRLALARQRLARGSTVTTSKKPNSMFFK